jgi:hypothetical protein
MRLLAVVQGEYGDRMVANIRANAPEGWTLDVWRAPRALPPVIDDPDEFLPDELPEADLVLAFGEHPGVVELLPDILERTGAKSLVAGVDSEVWVPAGLANQVRKILDERGIASVWPKPLCSLTESTCGFPSRVRYEDARISEFARRFGMPAFDIETASGEVARVSVVRDAVCGCGRHVAEGLAGTSVREASEKAGMLHHHYPCRATMGIDPELGDTLMHVSGRILRNEVEEKLKGR